MGDFTTAFLIRPRVRLYRNKTGRCSCCTGITTIGTHYLKTALGTFEDKLVNFKTEGKGPTVVFLACQRCFSQIDRTPFVSEEIPQEEWAKLALVEEILSR